MEIVSHFGLEITARRMACSPPVSSIHHQRINPTIFSHVCANTWMSWFESRVGSALSYFQRIKKADCYAHHHLVTPRILKVKGQERVARRFKEHTRLKNTEGSTFMSV